MNRLSIQERSRILSCLVEGNSIRATCRMTGAAKGTVTKLLCDVGHACGEYHDKHVRNVPSKRVQCDEIWSFCYAKEKNVPADFKDQFRLWRCVDLDGALRRYKANRVLPHWDARHN